MTDVLITHRIPGLRVGAITELTPRLEQHVKAGNAKILPNEHQPWNGGDKPVVDVAAVVHLVASTGHAPTDEDTSED